MSQEKSYLLNIDGKPPQPSDILFKLTLALSETHHLNLDQTDKKLRRLIIDFCEEVRSKNLDEEDFEMVAVFLIKVLRSNDTTISEFLAFMDENGFSEK